MDIKNLVLGIAIFILTVSVGVYGINTLYGKAPDYNKYCPNIAIQQECADAGGRWINNTYIADPRSKPVPAEGGYCEYSYQKCQDEYDAARRVYSRNVFFIALPLGIIIIAIGALVFGLASVGGGLMAGGVGIFMYGIVQYWEFADDILKFGLSLAGLIIIIALAYYANYRWNFFRKKSEKTEKNNKKK